MFFTSGLYISKKSKKKKVVSWWIWNTICIMIFFLITGLIFIDKSTTQEFGLRLNDELNNLDKVDYDFICEGETERLLYESEYECKIIEPKSKNRVNIANLSGIISFKREFDTKYYRFNDTIKFEVPINTTHILVHISGYNNNKLINWSSGHNFNFVTKQEDELMKKEFLHNLFILFTLIFFSVPTMMVSFKSLAKKN
jgi:hypothetical protein